MANIQNDLNIDQPATSIYRRMFEIENRLLMERDINKFLGISIDMAIKISGAKRGWMIIFTKENQDVLYQTFKNMQKKDTEHSEFEINRSIIEKVKKDGNPVCLPMIQAGMELKQDKGMKKGKSLSMICIPLLKDKNVFGIIYLDNNTGPVVFKPETFTIIMEFANFASTAVWSLLEEKQLQNLISNIGKTTEKRE